MPFKHEDVMMKSWSCQSRAFLLSFSISLGNRVVWWKMKISKDTHTSRNKNRDPYQPLQDFQISTQTPSKLSQFEVNVIVWFVGGFKLDHLVLSSNETPNRLTEVFFSSILFSIHQKRFNSHHDCQAESPLDKQIKSSLLADAFNLLGVKRLDAQTLTSARLRARFLSLGGFGGREWWSNGQKSPRLFRV